MKIVINLIMHLRIIQQLTRYNENFSIDSANTVRFWSLRRNLYAPSMITKDIGKSFKVMFIYYLQIYQFI